MSEDAQQIKYRNEYIAAFEQGQSLMRSTVTTEGEVNGNQFVFLVSGSGNAEAVTRGLNGQIPARADNNQQYTVTMKEWHDLVRKTRFNYKLSQGPQTQIMQKTSIKVLNRKVDQDILASMSAATQTKTIDTVSSAAFLESIQSCIAELGNNEVPWDGKIFAAVSPRFMQELMSLDQFTSGDYITDRPWAGNDYQWTDMQGTRRWMDIHWFMHPRLPGVGTAAEQCFMYHMDAVGHGCDAESFDTALDYDKEQDYTFARASNFMGSTLLQNKGIIRMNYDSTVNFQFQS